MTRKEFLGSAAAFMAVRGWGAADALLNGKPNLKFGILSDIHITDWPSTETLRRAFRYYRDADVDAVMICGDLAHFGVLCGLEHIARAWFEVFPNDRGLGGKPVERLFIYGNHDVEPDQYGIGNVGLATTLMKCPGYRTQEVRDQALNKVGLGVAWEKCFHEPFAPIYRKKVRGYDFIGAHWDTQAKVRGLDAWFAANGKTLDPNRPFFYFQHPHLANTVYANSPFRHDDGSSTRLLSHYPNAVAFSGHSHITLTDDRGLWRGAFTSIGCSTLTPHGSAGFCTALENLYTAQDPNEPSRQGMLASVYDDRIVLERRDFVRNEELDVPWVVPLPATAETFAARAARMAAPQFAAGARPVLRFAKKLGGDGSVRFPPALAESKARAHDYGVTIEYRNASDVVESHTFHVYPYTACLPKAHDGDVKRLEFTVPAAYLPKYDMGEARATVVARSSLGATGRPIVSDWTTVPKM